MSAPITSVHDEYPWEPMDITQNRPTLPRAPKIPDNPDPPLIVYDGESDTLLLFLLGRRDNVVSYFGNDLALMLDPETDEFVGLQYDNVIASGFRRDPKLINLFRLPNLELHAVTLRDVIKAWLDQTNPATRHRVRVDARRERTRRQRRPRTLTAGEVLDRVVESVPAVRELVHSK